MRSSAVEDREQEVTEFGAWAAEFAPVEKELPPLNPISDDLELEDLLKVRNPICTECFVEKTNAGRCNCDWDA